MQIDILIVICSCFAPTPSLASMVVNHFKMRTDVLSHNLSGMGCSSGVIGIDMARHYLQVITHDPFAPTICPKLRWGLAEIWAFEMQCGGDAALATDNIHLRASVFTAWWAVAKDRVANSASCVALQSMPNKRVLIVAHENITNNYYPGNNRSCLVSNCLFRVGGAACLMSNRWRPAPSLPLLPCSNPASSSDSMSSSRAQTCGALLFKVAACLKSRLTVQSSPCHIFMSQAMSLSSAVHNLLRHPAMLTRHLMHGVHRRPADRGVAKYELMHSVRSHIGADDDAFNAIRQREDEDGIRGILLQRNVVPTAATALKTNIASLAPLVLPFTELVRPPRPAAPSDAWVCSAQC